MWHPGWAVVPVWHSESLVRHHTTPFLFFLILTVSYFIKLIFNPNKSHSCKGEEIVTKSIVQAIEEKTKKLNKKRLNNTAILVLDGNFVVSEKGIKEGLITIPTDFLWCLTHMTTSGKDNVGAHCRDLRFGIHGAHVK